MDNSNTINRDVLIVGGGPGGMSAALWCADLGMTSVIIERGAELGGQLLTIHNPVSNYLGAASRNGRELCDRFLRSVSAAKCERFAGTEISAVDIATHSVTDAGGVLYTGRAIVFATGVRRRELGVDGETRFAGLGLLDSGIRNRELAAGKRVAVIGGGDAAAENALLLAEYAQSIVLIHRGNRLTARGEFAAAILDHPKIEIRWDAIVQSFNGDARLQSLTLKHDPSGAVETVDVDLGLVRIGVDPNTELLRGKVDLDDRNYVIADSRCETSSPGIYAVGDVANPASPTIATAVGSGATAAKHINYSLRKG